MLRPLLVASVAILEVYTAKNHPQPAPVLARADEELADAANELGRRAEATDADLALAAVAPAQDQSAESYADVERLIPNATSDDHALRTLWRIVSHRYAMTHRVSR